MDFSDQTINTTPRIKNTISIKKSTITTTQQPKIQDDHDDDDYKHYSSNHQEQDGNFPIQMLTRNKSVASRGTITDANSTSTHSSRFKIEKQNSTGRTLHTAVIRAMSIRRTSSVSERYSRIHHQYANTFDVDDHDQEQDEELKKTGSKNNMKKQNKGSILKACKRIFGL